MKPTRRNPFHTSRQTALTTFLVAATGASLMLPDLASAADKNWVGGNGNFDSTAATAGWNGTKPGTGDNAFVNGGATVAITTNQGVVDIRLGTVASQSGVINQTAGTVTTTGWIRMGLASGATGTYNMSGGALNINSSGRLNVGGAGGGTGVFNLSGTGAITNTAGGSIRIGGGDSPDSSVGTGTFNVSGGSINSLGEIWVGQATGSTGTLNISSGTVNTHNWVALGRSGASGTLNLTGGTLTHDTANNSGGRFSIASGGGAAGTGVMNQTGGTFTDSSLLLISELGTATYNISGGTVNANGGVLMSQGNGSSTLNMQNGTGLTGALTNGGGNQVFNTTTLTMGGGAAATGATTINLAGGTLGVNRIVAGATSASKTVNFDGGVVRLRASDSVASPFISGVTTNVKEGGVKIDTNTFNGIITTNLVHSAAGVDGGLVKSGSGALALTGTNTYDGNTLVSGGGLVGSTTAALPGWNVSGKVTVAAGAGYGAYLGGAGVSLVDFNTILSTANYQTGSLVAIDTTNGDYTYDASSLQTATSAGTSVGLFKSGTNVLTLTGANTFEGGVTVSGGMLKLGGNDALGAVTNNLTAGSGTVDLDTFDATQNSLILGGGIVTGSAGNSLTLTTTGNAITVTGAGYAFATPAVTSATNIVLSGASGGNIIKTATAGNANIAGNIDLGGVVRTIALADTSGDSAPELTLGGIISNGGVTLDNGLSGVGASEWGSLLLSGANTYDGVTTITNGRLEITNANSLGSTVGGTEIGARGTLALGGSGQNVAGGGINLTEALTVNHTVSGNYGMTAIQSNNGANTLSGAITFGATAQIDVASGSTLAITSAITQTAASGLTKGGAGVMTLSGNNSYSGVTTVAGGTLSVATLANGGVDSPLGNSSAASGNLVIGGGTLQYTGATTTSDRGYTVATGAGGIDTANDLTLTGQVLSSGTGSFTKLGAGTLALTNTTGTNTLSGNAGGVSTAVNNGRLQLGGTSASPLAQTNVVTGELAVGTVNSASSPNVSLEINGGTTSISTYLSAGRGNGTNNAQSTISLNNDAVVNVANYSMGYANGVTGYTSSPSINFNGTSTFNNPGVFRVGESVNGVGGVSTVNITNSASVNLTGASAVIAIGDGGAGVLNQTGGSLTAANKITIGNAATGVGTYNLNGGVLSTTGVAKGAGTGTLAFNGGTLKATANDSTGGGTGTFVSGVTTTIGNGGATIDTNGFGVSVSTVLAPTVGSTGGLTKNGTGKLTLTANSTYTGATQVNAGTLLATGSLGATSGVTVENDATFAGTTTVAGSSLVKVGGTISPGDNGVGTISLANLDLQGTYTAGLTANGVNDLLSVSGTLNLGNSSLINILLGYNPVAGDSFDIANFGSYTGDGTPQFSFSQPLGSGLTWDTSQFTTNGVLTVVPEPSVALLGAAAGFMLLRRRRKGE